MADEVEIKFWVSAVAELEQKAREAGFQEVTPSSFERNVLYDRGTELRERGEVLRIRRYRERAILTHKSKGTAGKHKNRKELETVVEDGDELDLIFAALGYRPSFVYEKFRSEWALNGGHLVIDQTPIGNVAELEGPPEWIDEMAAKLGISEAQYVTASYAGLFLQWKQRTGSPANNMTFEECGTPRPH